MPSMYSLLLYIPQIKIYLRNQYEKNNLLNRITIRITEQEKEILLTNMKQYNFVNKSQYIRYIIFKLMKLRNEYIVIYDDSNKLSKTTKTEYLLIKELNKIGINLN